MFEDFFVPLEGMLFSFQTQLLIISHANKTLFEPPSTRLLKMAQKARKASLTWAELIKRIYEDDPLKCPFGHKMIIVGFITNPVVIKNILSKMGISTDLPELEEGGRLGSLSIDTGETRRIL